MKVGLSLSFGLHALILLAIIIANWQSVFVHRSSSMIPYSRQVSLFSSGDLETFRNVPATENKEKIISTNQKSPPTKAISTPTKSTGSIKSQGGNGKGSGLGKPGGVSTDVAFPHSYYLELVERKIESFFNPPVRKPGLVAEVHFELLRSGRISGLKLKKSSGNALFDQAAQRAVLSSVPLPPLPSEFGFDKLGVTYIFLAE
ncbi:MAG: TonB family protein [bacterium]|nr:TonB family protein [bacterium]